MNQNLKTTLISLAAALVVVLVGGLLGKNAALTPAQQQAITQSVVAALGGLRAGSLAGPDIPSPYLTWGGVEEDRVTMPIAATSSMACRTQSPAATSTPTLLSMRFDSFPVTAGSGFGAISIDVSTSSTNYGSSTPAFLSDVVIPSTGPTRVIIWRTPASSSPLVIGTTNNGVNTTTGESQLLLPPSTWITWRYATNTPGTFATYPTGECKASFLVL